MAAIHGSVQDTGKQLPQKQIAERTVPNCGKPRKPRPVPGDKGTFDVVDLLSEKEFVECDSTSQSEADEDALTYADDQFFMSKALEQASNSPDTDTKVGAVVVSSGSHSQRRIIIGSGWNRMPKGCEDRLPWASEGKPLEQKYLYVIHGGMAAITDALKNNGDKVEGSTLYITLFPDNKDAQLIREYGIKEVVYLENKYFRKNFAQASKIILEGVPCRHIKMNSK